MIDEALCFFRYEVKSLKLYRSGGGGEGTWHPPPCPFANRPSATGRRGRIQAFTSH